MIRKVTVVLRDELIVYDEKDYDAMEPYHDKTFYTVILEKDGMFTHKHFPLSEIKSVEVVSDDVEEEEDNIGTTNIKGYDC